jgi:hypothetical protein
MKILHLAPVAVLALLAPPRESDELAFRPDKGTRVVRTVSIRSHDKLESASLSVNGEEMPSDGSISMEIEHTSELVFADRFGASEGGRALEITRTFEKLGASTNTRSSDGEEDADETEDEKSALEGARVVFRWNAEDEDYDAGWPEGESHDGALLEDLAADLDLRGFLPDESVEEGAEWKVDVDAMRSLLDVGGDLKLEVEDADPDDTKLEDEMDRGLMENLEGDVNATYGGRREVDGRTMGVIEVRGELRTHAESGEDGDAGSTKSAATLELEVTAEILWDLRGGHLGGYSFKAPTKLSVTHAFRASDEDTTFEFEQTLNFEGELETRCAIERRD